MNKLLPLAFVAASCAHAQLEPDNVRPLSDIEKARIESCLAEPPSLKPEIDAEITGVAREVAQCVFKYGQTRENAGDYRARLLVHRPDKEDVIAEALVRPNGDISLALDRDAYMDSDHSRTQVVDHGIDGEVDWYKFENLCRLCPGPRRLEFKKEPPRRDFRDERDKRVWKKNAVCQYDAQDAYEKTLRMVVERCRQAGKKGIRGK